MNNTLLSFPQRLYNMLKFCEEQGREDIMSWEKEGTAFKVNDVHEFERCLLPLYANTKKYYTFTRALYAYGFTCVRTGRQTGIYSHPSFNRNDPLGPSLMKRVLKRKNKRAAVPKRAASSKVLATPNHAVSNPFSETFSLRSGLLNRQQICGEARRPDDGNTAIVFGRVYYTVTSQDDERQASQPVQILPEEMAGIFDGEARGKSVDTRPSPNPMPSSSTATNQPFLYAVANSNGTTA